MIAKLTNGQVINVLSSQPVNSRQEILDHIAQLQTQLETAQADLADYDLLNPEAV